MMSAGTIPAGLARIWQTAKHQPERVRASMARTQKKSFSAGAFLPIELISDPELRVLFENHTQHHSRDHTVQPQIIEENVLFRVVCETLGWSVELFHSDSRSDIPDSIAKEPIPRALVAAIILQQTFPTDPRDFEQGTKGWQMAGDVAPREYRQGIYWDKGKDCVVARTVGGHRFQLKGTNLVEAAIILPKLHDMARIRSPHRDSISVRIGKHDESITGSFSEDYVFHLTIPWSGEERYPSLLERSFEQALVSQKEVLKKRDPLWFLRK
ncbi:MAG: hypothetical protein ABIE84_02540 [bacterium]